MVEYSVYVSKIVLEGFKFEVFMYDVLKVFIGDVFVFLKLLFEDYWCIEVNVIYVIMDCFGLFVKILVIVKVVD